MKKYEQYNRQETGHVKEMLIQPEMPEQPLILLRKEKEGGLSEALFMLELTGVIRKDSDRQSSDNPRLDDNDNFDKSGNLLLSGISLNQRVDFIYRAFKDENGKSQLDLKIAGYSIGETPADAVSIALRLWQNLSVSLGIRGDEYCFAPIMESERLYEKEHREAWVGVVNPMGIAIEVNQQIPVGFTQVKPIKPKVGVMIVPESENKRNQQFDAVVIGKRQ